ncbi:hypothetical protein [Caulobacter sp.]|uniref:hypothetical protein n=1 Tax=Caulobacter sp. TaxID=78 RepID=UPI001B200126|nr:hypothetical protein [Caulobacter sp.]MBO9547157.1 hypothetical protein [Caulobacter sp.]
MGCFEPRRVLLTASFAALLGLTACATGQGSFVAGSGGSSSDGEAFAFDESGDTSFEQNAPGLLAASGNALLPGGRNLAPPRLNAATTNAAPLLSTGPVNADLNANVSLLNGSNASVGLNSALGSVNVNAALGGPLLALNGSNAALLGINAIGPNVMGVTPNLTASLGGAINPATAATQTLISATVGATQQPSQPTTGQPPLLPPVLGVPGATPLQTLLPLLTTPKPPVLPGLLGQ